MTPKTISDILPSEDDVVKYYEAKKNIVEMVNFKLGLDVIETTQYNQSLIVPFFSNSSSFNQSNIIERYQLSPVDAFNYSMSYIKVLNFYYPVLKIC